MRIILAVFIVLSSLNAQYKKEFRDLIETTYLRTFDKPTILKYLISTDADSTSAALLSIANSNDKSFIQDIINLEEDDLLIEKSFALGKLGGDSLSELFLLKNIENLETDFNSQRIFFEALGNVISQEKLIELLEAKNHFSGLPFSLVNAINRKLEIEKDSISNYLIKNFENKNSDLVFSSLYVLYRISPPVGSENYFAELVTKDFSSNDTEIKTYALGCLRKLNRFPLIKKDFKKLFKNDDWKIRTELAKTAVFTNRFNDLVDLYFELLLDKNPNVSRQTAISLREIKPGIIRKAKLDSVLQNILSQNTLGEFLISYSTLFPNECERLIEEYSPRLSRKFIFEIIDNIDEADTRFELLKKEIINSSAIDRIYLSASLLKLQDEFRRDENYSRIIISLLRENNAPVISIIADGLNDDFISANSNIIQEIVLDHLFTKINDPNYLESIQSLLGLSKKVNTQFEIQVSDIILNSKVTSIKNIASGISIKENDKMFEKIFEESFNYSEAIVTTTKGQFIFELIPEVAPISVGSFCYLANKKYFNNVKFHRVVPNFVIQSGDSTSTGWGGPGYDIISEFSWLPFDTGFVGMASAGKDTEGSQWFVMHNYYPHLNGNYSVFGKLLKGQEVVDLIDQDDVVLEITLSN